MTSRSITATQRYRWALDIDGADGATHHQRALAALRAIADDVAALPLPAQSQPTPRLPHAALSTNLGRAIVAEEPVDPWAAYPPTF